MKSKLGFTLVEIMVAVTIVSILAGIVGIKAIDVGRKSRDTDRQADLRALQSAVELYKNKYGQYPDQCTNATPPTAGGWSGQTGTSFACASGSQYIIGLAPEFIPSLPKDPKLNGNGTGYVYRVNATKTAYKIVVFKTVESEVVSNSHPLKACDVTNSNIGICDTTSTALPWSGGTPPKCQDVNFTSSYGVWGGYPNEPFSAIPARKEEQVENTICRLP